MNVIEEVRYIRFMFENVREDVDANRPDRFIGSGTSKRSQTLAGPSGLGLPVGSSNPLYRTDTAGRVDAGLSDGLFKMKQKVTDLEKGVEGYGSATTSEVNHMRSALTDDLSRLKGRLHQKMTEIEGLEKDIESHGQKVFESKEDELRQGAGDLEKEIFQAVEKKEHEVEVKATDATVNAAGRIQATLELKDPFREEKRDL